MELERDRQTERKRERNTRKKRKKYQQNHLKSKYIIANEMNICLTLKNYIIFNTQYK